MSIIIAMPGIIGALERDFAVWLGVPRAVATGYGRSAAHLAVRILTCVMGSKASDGEVLVPDFICRQIPEAVRLAGARVRYYRVPRDLAIHSEDLRAVVTPQTRAAVVPHYFGRLQPSIPDLARTCRELGIVLIEDCALALGATDSEGYLAGSRGDLAIFSFTKSDWCYGGGLLSVRDPLWTQQVRSPAATGF